MLEYQTFPLITIYVNSLSSLAVHWNKIPDWGPTLSLRCDTFLRSRDGVSSESRRNRITLLTLVVDPSASKIRFNLSFAIPIPVSITQNSCVTLRSSGARGRVVNATCHLRRTLKGANFMALPTKLVITCRRRSESPISWSRISGSTSYPSFHHFWVSMRGHVRPLLYTHHTPPSVGFWKR